MAQLRAAMPLHSGGGGRRRCVGTALLALLGQTAALDNGRGRLPPMGYNTWNDVGCFLLSEATVLATARALVRTGLRDLGYRYVNLDDCWHDVRGRNASTGRLVEDPFRFPSGLKALGGYLHGMGLKFGIYTDRGSRTCAGRPGSLGHEELDARTFAEWEVDYVKEDNCFASTGANDQDTLFRQFGRFRDALNQTGRRIFFSVCGGGDQRPWANLSYYATDPRGGAALANSWRISSDCINWSTCLNAYAISSELVAEVGPGGFNDPDMLLGSSRAGTRRLSRAQSRTQFNILAVLMAPLLIGAPIRGLDRYDLETYRNREVLAVNQDLLGKQGFRLTPPGSQVVWGRPLAGGDWALVFQNDHFWGADVLCDELCWKKLSFHTGAKIQVRDLWAHRLAERPVAVAGKPYSVKVPPWGASKMFRLSLATTAFV